MLQSIQHGSFAKIIVNYKKSKSNQQNLKQIIDEINEKNTEFKLLSFLKIYQINESFINYKLKFIINFIINDSSSTYKRSFPYALHTTGGNIRWYSLFFLYLKNVLLYYEMNNSSSEVFEKNLSCQASCKT